MTPYFPCVVDLTNKFGLIVGGGRVALRKIQILSKFACKLRVVAKRILPEIKKIGENLDVDCVESEWKDDDWRLGDYDFIVLALDDRDLQRRIARQARRIRIPVNVVDDPDSSSFLFPAIMTKGRFVVAVSTSGISPAAAANARDQIADILPDDVDEIVEWLADIRPEIAALHLDPQRKKLLYKALWLEATRLFRPLSRAETQDVVRKSFATTIDDQGPGRVDIIGAGSGDATIMTREAMSKLRKCDVALYDDLVHESVLNAIPKSALKIYAGKRACGRATRQETINSKMIELARSGKRVARLKGGDPFLFGRGGEEALALRAAGIPYSVTPGVSSAIYIPMLAGIPATHRGASRCLHIVTARVDGDNAREDFEKWAKLDGTLVIMMGTGELGRATQALLDSGKAPETPVAVVRGGSAGKLRAIRGTLADVMEKFRLNPIEPPTVIVVGDVAAMNVNEESWR